MQGSECEPEPLEVVPAELLVAIIVEQNRPFLVRWGVLRWLLAELWQKLRVERWALSNAERTEVSGGV